MYILIMKNDEIKVNEMELFLVMIFQIFFYLVKAFKKAFKSCVFLSSFSLFSTILATKNMKKS